VALIDGGIKWRHLPLLGTPNVGFKIQNIFTVCAAAFLLINITRRPTYGAVNNEAHLIRAKALSAGTRQ
jgi:hypothetical protein